MYSVIYNMQDMFISTDFIFVKGKIEEDFSVI